MKKGVLIFLLLVSTYGLKAQTQINSLGSYVWNSNDEPKTFNYKLQLSFVNSNKGFPSYGTVLAGGGYSTNQDGGAFQLYFPYNDEYGGIAPKIRLGKFNNQGWSNWETFYTSANANKSSIDWNVKKLHVSDRIGIGTSNPFSKLHVINDNFTVTSQNGILVQGTTIGNGNYTAAIGFGYAGSMDAAITGIQEGSDNNSMGLAFFTHPSAVSTDPKIEAMRITKNGNVGIGTTSTGTHKLAVDGTIGAREIIVETGTWSDFVFDDNYKLKDLEEVENFIEENNHLPDIPSEKEVLENGIQVGEMNAKLLQKIEELTLYMIEQNKKTEKLIEKVETLESKNKELEEKILKLETTK